MKDRGSKILTLSTFAAWFAESILHLVSNQHVYSINSSTTKGNNVSASEWMLCLLTNHHKCLWSHRSVVIVACPHFSSKCFSCSLDCPGSICQIITNHIEINKVWRLLQKCQLLQNTMKCVVSSAINQVSIWATGYRHIRRKKIVLHLLEQAELLLI